jgi:DNA polymerase-3 subunit alpha
MSFVHLHLHSEYSIVDGLIRIEPLIEAVVASGMPACALTDQGNLFAMIKFYKAAIARGIKPVIGVELWLRHPERPGGRSRFVLLCQNPIGYRNLSRIISRSYIEGQTDGVPQVRRAWLDDGCEGLIMLSGGRDGDVGQALLAGNPAMARAHAENWRRTFGDRFYLELQRTGRAREGEYIDATIDLAGNLDIPVVATNDVRFLAPGDYEAHEARVCIFEGRVLEDPRRPRPYSEQQYLRTAAEMRALFADIPEAIDNTLQIAKRCNLEFALGNYHLPAFPVPAGGDVDEWLRQEALQGLVVRLAADAASDGSGGGDERQGAYRQRLASELAVIVRMGFAGYFLIVADFIRWAKMQGIPVGPGRGSGAGSLVAYALGITELDPLRYDLLFERFLNPERVSMPDFDIDFCMDRRDEVIRYVAERYGRDRVSQIITHGTMAAKAVVRDVGRVLDKPFGFVDEIAKLIPFALDMTLARAMNEEPRLAERYRQEEDVRTLIDLAMRLEGLTRNAGRHAGGVVIAPLPLTEFTPLYCEQGSDQAVTQLDMLDLEAVGLVKFDFLGLRTLTIIDWAIKDVNARGAAPEPLHANRLPLDDRAAYEVFAGANTTAVFQFESRGMRDLLKRAKPDRFEDIIALVALYRPGPMDLIPDFIDRKHGRQAVVYQDPRLKPILGPTYGVMVYQEQVMQIAQVIGGYSLGGADLLRRAMGKKKPEEMAKHRDIFVAGAEKNGIARPVANELFGLMEKFAGYGFNKSHAAAYALVAYQTAWLKAHHGAAFMAAVLSAEMTDTDKVVVLIHDCRRMGIEVRPPAINDCAYRFTVADERIVRYGLGAIKGAGESAIDALIGERESGGPYRDLFDLCRRVDTRRANRRVLEALIRAGVLDSLGPGRAAMMATLGHALQAAEQQGMNEGAGQDDLFGIDRDHGSGEGAVARFQQVADWPPEELLLAERATLGWSPSGHLMDPHEGEIDRLNVTRLVDLKPGRRRIAGIVDEVRTRSGRRGRMAFVVLDDRTARVEVAVYSEVFQTCAEVLTRNRLVLVEGDYRADDFSGDYVMSADKVMNLDQARQEYAKAIRLRLDARRMNGDAIGELCTLLDQCRRGRCPVLIEYRGEQGVARLRLGSEWSLQPGGVLLDRLQGLLGQDGAAIEY